MFLLRAYDLPITFHFHEEKIASMFSLKFTADTDYIFHGVKSLSFRAVQIMEILQEIILTDN